MLKKFTSICNNAVRQSCCTDEVSTVTSDERDFMTIEAGGTKTHENISQSLNTL
jgi:hypothetical protein